MELRLSFASSLIVSRRWLVVADRRKERCTEATHTEYPNASHPAFVSSATGVEYLHGASN